jgi:hypothetical protein
MHFRFEFLHLRLGFAQLGPAVAVSVPEYLFGLVSHLLIPLALDVRKLALVKARSASEANVVEFGLVQRNHLFQYPAHVALVV